MAHYEYEFEVLALSAGVLLDHLTQSDRHLLIAMYDLLHIE